MMRRSGKAPRWENCLIATVDDVDSRGVYAALKRTGLKVLRLAGHEGVGPMSALHNLERESGGDFRILDEVYQELSHGNAALVVEVASDRLTEVSSLLYRTGAKSVWEFDELTFVKKDLERLDQSRAD